MTRGNEMEEQTGIAEEPILSVYTDLLEARNRRDADTFAGLFTSTGSVVGAGGGTRTHDLLSRNPDPDLFSTLDGSRSLYFNLDRLDVADDVGSAMPIALHWLHVTTGISCPRHHSVSSHARRCAPMVFPQTPAILGRRAE